MVGCEGTHPTKQSKNPTGLLGDWAIGSLVVFLWWLRWLRWLWSWRM